VSAKAGSRVVIIRKKVAAHDDEHGGAWKVAYADFVTAMMALFIVLWLLSASEKVQKAVGGYFADPTGKGRQTGTTTAGAGETLTLNRTELEKLKEKIDEVMKQIPALKNMQNQVRVTLTTEGLRVDLIETEHGLFFETGNPKPTEAGALLLHTLAVELAKLPNKVAIEGHTDATPYGRPDYTNWELSSDRANAARRILMASGFDESRISQVRGFADQRLLKKDEPGSPSNRRISIIVRNAGLDQQEEAMSQSEPTTSGVDAPAASASNPPVGAPSSATATNSAAPAPPAAQGKTSAAAPVPGK